MNNNFSSFVANTKVVFGPGAVAELPEKIKPFTPSRAVIVTTKEVVETGIVDTVKDLLSYQAHGPFSPDYLEVCSGAGEVLPFTYWSYQANRRSRKSF